jgi:hypothetical protein
LRVRDPFFLGGPDQSVESASVISLDALLELEDVECRLRVRVAALTQHPPHVEAVREQDDRRSRSLRRRSWSTSASSRAADSSSARNICSIVAARHRCPAGVTAHGDCRCELIVIRRRAEVHERSDHFALSLPTFIRTRPRTVCDGGQGGRSRPAVRRRGARELTDRF